MKNSRDNQLSDRRAAAAEAKAALLKAYHAARISDEPARAARQAERASIVAAREERRLERARVKLEQQARAEVEAAELQAAAHAAALAEAEAHEKAEKERVARVIKDEAARKAARDLRYANRKARRT
ncbi:hypothetical protein I6F07_16220 [Ensifer sp. IC4062]|nr:hypothetical protein [Ensifer sp. IC4062]